MTSEDGSAQIAVQGQLAKHLPANSVLGSLSKASAFFQAGSLGYSPTSTAAHYDGLELQTFNWSVSPLLLQQVESSFFDDPAVFPPGSVELDHALRVQKIRHRWHG